MLLVYQISLKLVHNNTFILFGAKYKENPMSFRDLYLRNERLRLFLSNLVPYMQ